MRPSPRYSLPDYWGQLERSYEPTCHVVSLASTGESSVLGLGEDIGQPEHRSEAELVRPNAQEWTAALLLTVLLAGCLALGVRQGPLLQSAQQSWSSVIVDVRRGISDGVQDGDLPAAQAASLRSLADELTITLQSGSLMLLSKLDWPLLPPWAERGVQAMLDDSEIDPQVAGILMRRDQTFWVVLRRLGE